MYIYNIYNHYIYIFHISCDVLNPCFFRTVCWLSSQGSTRDVSLPSLRSTEGLRLSTQKTRSGQWYTMYVYTVYTY